MALTRFEQYPGWIHDLRVVVNGGAPNQASLDSAVQRLRDALQVVKPDDE